MKHFITQVALANAVAFSIWTIFAVVPDLGGKLQLLASFILAGGLLVVWLRQANDKDWQRMCTELTAMQNLMHILLEDKRKAKSDNATV